MSRSAISTSNYLGAGVGVARFTMKVNRIMSPRGRNCRPAENTEYLNLRGLCCLFLIGRAGSTDHHYIPLSYEQWINDDMHLFVNNEPKVVTTESCRYDIHICGNRATFFSNRRYIDNRKTRLVSQKFRKFIATQPIVSLYSISSCIVFFVWEPSKLNVTF